jgi:hypothetical protein
MPLQKLLLLVSLAFGLFSTNASSQEKDQFSAPDLAHSSRIARYPSGEVGWFKTVQDKIRYENFPQSINLDTISIIMKFVVPRDGKIRDIVFFSGDKRIQRPVRKVLLQSENWIAASHGGRYVNSFRKVKFQFRFDPIIKEWIFDRDASAYLVL